MNEGIASTSLVATLPARRGIRVACGAVLTGVFFIAACATEPTLRAVEVDAGVMAGFEEGRDEDDATSLPVTDLALATACATDADCTQVYPLCASVQSGLWGPGGPSGGYCTRSCTLVDSPSDDECGRIDPNSACRQPRPGVDPHCMLSCGRGTPIAAEEKCQGRGELACVNIDRDSGAGECRPTCGIDLDCAAGTACNLTTGFCEPQPLDSALGASCDPRQQDESPCPGWCYELAEGVGVCTGRCTIGALIGCGYEAPPRLMVCAFAEDDSLAASGAPLAGAGDLGLCLPSCSCTSECPSGAQCLALGEFEAFVIGRAGLCLSPDLAGDARPELSNCP